MNMLKSITTRLIPFALTVLLAIGVVAAPATADTVNVKMGGDDFSLSFVPAAVTVAPGDTLHFDVNQMGPHNVVFEGDLAGLSHANAEMSGGFDITIPADTAAGDYSYYCEPHRGANMVGTVTVSG